MVEAMHSVWPEVIVGHVTENNQSSAEVNRTALNSTDALFHVSAELVTLLSILYGSISVLTIVGNALIIVVIVKNRSMNTVTNFFIANLSVADVIVGFFSIPFQFQAALLQRWDLPTILCPVAPFVKELSVNVSVIALVVISIDRYFAVLHPLKRRFSRSSAKIVMALVWAFSITSAVPSLIVFRVVLIPDEELNAGSTKPFCYPQFPVVAGWDLGYVYRLYLVFVQYFVPLVIISWAYVLIIHRIWLSKAPGTAVDSRDQLMHKNKKKVIKMLIIVVGLFAFCWLPIQTYNLLSELHPQINLYKYINIIWFSSNWLAMSNSCCNPFIYGLLNEKFKQGFHRLFRRCLSPLGLRHSSSGLDRYSEADYSIRRGASGKGGGSRGSRASTNSNRRSNSNLTRANTIYVTDDDTVKDDVVSADQELQNRPDPKNGSEPPKNRFVPIIRTHQKNRCDTTARKRTDLNGSEMKNGSLANRTLSLRLRNDSSCV